MERRLESLLSRSRQELPAHQSHAGTTRSGEYQQRNCRNFANVATAVRYVSAALTLDCFSRTKRLRKRLARALSLYRSSLGEQIMPQHSSRRFIILILIAVSIATLTLAGCSNGGGGNSLHVKSPAAGEKDLAVKSAYTFAVTKSFTDINQKITTAVVYNVSTANYDLDATNFGMTLEKPMASEDQMRKIGRASCRE